MMLIIIAQNVIKILIIITKGDYDSDRNHLLPQSYLRITL